MARIPYVIDNDQHKLADVLNQVLEDRNRSRVSPPLRGIL